LPVALGGGSPNNKKVEVLQTGKWSELADFPFVDEYICKYAFVNFNNALYLFGKISILEYNYLLFYTFSVGGYADGKVTDIAVRMDEIYIDENIWTNVGPLLSIRYGRVGTTWSEKISPIFISHCAQRLTKVGGGYFKL